MKHILSGCVTLALSLCITFFIFEVFSWYHFGDYPTPIVFVRLLAVFLIVVGILRAIHNTVSKIIKHLKR